MNLALSEAIFDRVCGLNPDASLSEKMKLSNDMYSNVDYLNETTSKIEVFPKLDVYIQSVLDGLLTTEKERDIAYLVNFCEKAWKILHVDLKSKFENPKQHDIETLLRVYRLLVKYGLQHELLCELTEKQYLKLVKPFDVTAKKPRKFVWRQTDESVLNSSYVCTLPKSSVLGGNVLERNGDNYSTLHDSGWLIKAKLHEDCYEWVEDFLAIHEVFGFVEGNFNEMVVASSKKAYEEFTKEFNPNTWDIRDI
jgi:hypothetical protein